MNYLEFLEALTRISIKGKKVFNKFHTAVEQKKKEELKKQEMDAIIDG